MGVRSRVRGGETVVTFDKLSKSQKRDNRHLTFGKNPRTENSCNALLGLREFVNEFIS
jgi:hypothetical protein